MLSVINLYKNVLMVLTVCLAFKPATGSSAKSRPGRTAMAEAGQQMQQQISGTVTDAEGFPLPGVSVVIVDQPGGTATDEEGKFVLTAAAGATVRLSMVGYVVKEFAVTGQEHYDLELEPDVASLSEVVVVGYGTQKKVNLSGAVDHVDAEALEHRPISNVSQGLQGLVPNLNIRFNSGEPGQAADVNIRGITSINGGAPLIMIDGVQSSSAELNLIAPQDIASISVVKDASAAAIYGARAAFGVILITTKTGTEAGTHVSYSSNFIWNTPTVMPDMVTDPYVFSRVLEISTDNTPWDNVNYNDQFYEYARQRSDNPGTPGVRVNPSDETLWEYMGNRDWTRYFFDDYNFSYNHDLAISGVSENSKVRYYLSGGYNRQNSALALAEDYSNRYNLRAKVDYQLADWIRFGNNTSMSNTLRKSPSRLNVAGIYNFFPTYYDVNPDGTWANSPVGRAAAEIVDGGEATNRLDQVQTQFTAELNFLAGLLKVNADYTYRKTSENYNSFRNTYMIGYGPDDVREEGDNAAYRMGVFDYYRVFNMYGTLNKVIGRHSLTAILGFSQENYRREQFDVTRSGLISSSFPTIGLATGDATGNEVIDTYALRGAFYRLGYIYDDRYILEFNGRYDGSSRFPKEGRFGFFPSGSVAWRIDQETFMEDTRNIISNLKLRASYGSLGNQSVANYGYIPSMSTYQTDYLIGGERPFGISTPGLVSPNYTWEKVNTLNFGIDLGFLQEKISLVFDRYTRNTLGMLTLGRDLPDILGASEPSENAADLRTRGWELSLGYRNSYKVGGQPFNLETRFVLSDSRSTITRFDNPGGSITQYYKGMDMGEIWGLQYQGQFNSTEEIASLDESAIIPWGALQIVPGWPKFKDMDGNGRIEKGYTLNDTKDLTVIGNSAERLRFGVDLNMNWKGFDMRMFWQGVGKRDYYPLHFLYWGVYQQPYGNVYQHLLDFYRAEADGQEERAKHSQSYLALGLADQNLDGRFPVLQSWMADVNLGTRIDQSMGMAIPNTGFMMNGAYLRLKNLTIGYTLPRPFTERLGISSLRVFATGENVLEFSEIRKHFDPETTNASINTNPAAGTGSMGGNGMTYPFQRSYSLGVNIML